MGSSFLALFLCASLSVDVTDMSLDESSSSSELSELESSELESAKILGFVFYVVELQAFVYSFKLYMFQISNISLHIFATK